MALRALPIGALTALTAAALLTAPAALGQPAPDPAPTQPSPAPDPAPSAPPASSPPSSSPPSSSPPATSAPATPVAAPEQPAPAASDLPAASDDASSEDRASRDDRTDANRGDAKREASGATPLSRRIAPDVAFLRVTSLLPISDDSDDSSSGTLFIAAAGLLLLVMAAGSMTSVLARLLPPTAVLLVVLAAPAYAHAETITATCSTPSGIQSCNQWYSSPWVTLQWNWDPGGMILSGCSNGNFMSETRFDRSCRVEWTGSGTTVIKDVWIGVDRTGPQITGLQTSRAPDYNGWFNHPVGLSFRGSDGLSGVKSCSGLTYSGPDGAGALVNGSCTDVAGNTRSAKRSLNYDSTAPPAPEVTAAPRDNAVKLEWTVAPQTVAVVTRMRNGQETLVYRGGADAFTDRKLRNEKRYRYRVSLVDQAGNSSSGSDTAVPTDSPLLTPAANEHVGAPPLLTWRTVARASYYNVQLFRGRRKILSRWPAAREFQLKRSWRFGGERRRLRAGRYCWHVWPGYGKRARRDYGELLGSRCFRYSP